MATTGNEEGSGRESRLLMLVVGVSVAVLFVLARFRFAGGDAPVVAPSAAPLAGLTARATFDEMAGSIADVLTRVSDALVVVELAAAPLPGPAGPARGAAQPAPEAPKSSIWTTALRVGHDTAILYVPAGWHPVRALNFDGPLTLVGSDPATETALVYVPAPSHAVDGLPPRASGFSAPSYVAVIGAAAGGLSADPVFIGRVDTMNDPVWPRPLVRVSGHADLRAGEMVFTMDSGLLGMVAGSSEISRIVPPDAIQALAQQLTTKGRTP